MCDSYFPDSPTLTSKKIVFKDTRISKPSSPPTLPNIIHIEEMFFMHKYIERIVDVKDDGNNGFQVIPSLLDKREHDHKFVQYHFYES